jgi:HEAT repeat protein
VYWCFHCYAVNSAPEGSCVRCGRPVEGPPGRSYDEHLMWALRHPDGDRAVVAAQTLGIRKVRAALPALRRVVDEDRDPYLSAAALRAALEIAGPDELRDWLEQLARWDSFMVRSVARRALGSTGWIG